MTRTKILLAAIAATALATVAAAPASAKIVNVTYTGTVSYGYDSTGLFGTAGADLTGQSYVATYKFDDAKGQYTYINYNGANYSYGYGDGSPSLGATITIGGHSVSVAGTSFGEIYAYNSGGFAEQYHAAQDSTSSDTHYSNTNLTNYTYGYGNGNLPGETGTPFSGIGQYSNGYFQAYDYDYNSWTYTNYTSLGLTPTNLTIAGAVPEPATWLMLILGFGAVGGAIRSAKRRSAGRVAFA